MRIIMKKLKYNKVKKCDAQCKKRNHKQVLDLHILEGWKAELT